MKKKVEIKFNEHGEEGGRGGGGGRGTVDEGVQLHLEKLFSKEIK